MTTFTNHKKMKGGSWVPLGTETRPGTVTMATPARPANVQSEIMVPLWLALITAGAGTALAGWLVASLTTVGAWTMVKAMFGLFLILFFGLFVLFSYLMQKSLWHVQKYQDMAPAETVVQKTELRVTMAGGGGGQDMLIDVDADKLRLIARGTLGADRPFSQREWKRLLSRAQYEELRDTLMSLEPAWLVWKNPGNKRQGVEWTEAGKNGLSQIAGVSLSSPTDEAE